MILFSICDWPWWTLWLLWLLPLLLAALLWWWQDNKYDKMVDDYEGTIKGLNGRIDALEDDLTACKKKRSELESDLALTKGRMREMEAEMKSLRDNGGNKSSLKSKKSKKSSGKGGAKGSSSVKDSGSAKDAGGAGLGAITSSLAATGAGLSSGGGSGSGSSSGGDSGSGGAGKSVYAKVKSDNLQIIEGIGPKMESILKENGIDIHATLGNKSLEELQAILSKYGDKYKIIDPKSWANQASLAGNGDFDGLISLQKSLNIGKGNTTGMSDSKLEKYLIKIGAMKAFKQDDLKAIEGIGPATDKLLRENGINTWRDLASSSSDSIKAILTAAGSRFALGDPSTWPKQAELAADGKFDELREYQDFLDGGKA
jgi:predicted flap endonuclease-1-like 5' DNA nuclease